MGTLSDASAHPLEELYTVCVYILHFTAKMSSTSYLLACIPVPDKGSLPVIVGVAVGAVLIVAVVVVVFVVCCRRRKNNRKQFESSRAFSCC